MSINKRYDHLSRDELIQQIEMLKRSYKAVSQDTTTVEALLIKNYGNISKTAKELGVDRCTLASRIKHKNKNRVHINKDGTMIPLFPTRNNRK